MRARSNPTISSARCKRQPIITCATRVRFQLPSAADEPQQPRRQERAIVRLVRPLFCLDQLARARPAAPCPAEAPRSLSVWGHATPPRAARTPMCVNSVPYRDPTGLLTGCCCASFRPGVRLSVLSSSSRPFGCSRRVLGLILRLYLRCIRSPPRTQRSSSRFLDGRGARSCNADERLLLQEKEERRKEEC